MVVRIVLFSVVFLITIFIALGLHWVPSSAFTHMETLALKAIVIIGCGTCTWLSLCDGPFNTKTSAVRKG